MSRYLLQFIALLFYVSSVPKICADDKHISSDVELSAQLVDDSILKGSIVESSFTFHTSYGDLEVPFNEVRKIVNKGDINDIVIEMKNGDVLKGSFYKKYLKINCLLGNVKLFYDYIKIISFTHSVYLDKNFDKDWNIEFIDAISWDYSFVDTVLVVKEIVPSIINEEGGGTWAVVRLVKDVSPIRDFSAIFKYAWNTISVKTDNIQYLKLNLYNGEDKIIAGGGYTDAWIGYSGTQIYILGDIKKILGKGTSPPSGKSKLTLHRSGEKITIKINDEEVISGQNSDPISKIKIEFGFYALINYEQASSFGDLSIEEFILKDNLE
jgi:hypothetical protein